MWQKFYANSSQYLSWEVQFTARNLKVLALYSKKTFRKEFPPAVVKKPIREINPGKDKNFHLMEWEAKIKAATNNFNNNNNSKTDHKHNS